MPRLIDVNVCLRLLMGDTKHPEYLRCVEILTQGGEVRKLYEKAECSVSALRFFICEYL